jgi:hypothetical protein
MGRVASFHLVRERRWRAPLVLARLGLDRRRLRVVDGLVFWRLLGTGRGDETASSSDLRRSALFAVWEDEAALDRFLDDHLIARRWEHAEEVWHVRLRGAGGHGAWRGVAVLEGLERGDVAGPVAVLTRADVRPRAWRAFARASRRVGPEARAARGLLAVVGIGEAPIARLGTFSLWASRDDALAFATAMPEHLEVVRRTRADDWYGEELFARFEPFSSSGTWGGRDPLRDG